MKIKMTRLIIVLAILLLSALNNYSQTIAIEKGTKILYKYVPNPLKIVVENEKCEDIIVKTKVGRISRETYRDSCHFIYWCQNCEAKKDFIFVGIKSIGKTRWIDSLEYNLRDETINAIELNLKGCLTDCTFDKNDFQADTVDNEILLPGMSAPLINFDIELNYPISEYSVEQLRNDSVIFSVRHIKGCRFSNELLHQIQISQQNDKFRFFDVSVVFEHCEQYIKGKTITIK
jgi:hypothetical protein